MFKKVISNLRLTFSLRKYHQKLQLEGDRSTSQSENKKILKEIEKNVAARKGSECLKEIQSLFIKLNNENLTATQRTEINRKLQSEFMKLPNQTHPDVVNYDGDPKIVGTFGKERQFSFEPKQFSDISKRLNILRMEHLGNLCGHKSYYFINEAAQLEHSLIKFAVNELKQHNFQLITVPDILPASVIEGCGMSTIGERTQVYKIASSDLCLSGTSEMALAGYFANKVLQAGELPKKVMAVSRCFRAETSGLQEEKGIYRVHQFTKVEMFSVCSETQSEQMLDSFKETEINLFSKLGLCFKLLDMPPCELGRPAYRKYDIEAWMPGRKMWGELSSCSNCTDWQTKRLNIKYRTSDGQELYAHTVNGTACAIPRLLIAILENYQTANGTVEMPNVLRPFLRNHSEILKQKGVPELKLVKNIESPRIV